ncbi:MAG: MurR/RpiR family transcriptional regulator [Microbacteriaceae bacterium]|nr:MurR/RpiR family transcriptional regulator [Microbacteriaceae bacterium]
MTEDILVRLKQLTAVLRPSEVRVAELALQDPMGVSQLTIGQLASRGRTSATTVTRLCKQAGFDGYRSFRQALTVAAVSDRGRRIDFGVSNGDIDLSEPAEQVYRKLAYEEARTLEDTVGMLDLDTVSRVVHAIDRAPRIDVYGQASSALAAQDLQQKISRIGCQANAWSDGHLALMSAATLPPEAVAIGFSHSGETEETIQSLEAAHRQGAFTVAVTNFPDASIAAAASAVLTTVSKETRFRYGAMSSRMAQFIVVDVLFMGVAALHPERTREALTNTYNAVQRRQRSQRER